MALTEGKDRANGHRRLCRFSVCTFCNGAVGFRKIKQPPSLPVRIKRCLKSDCFTNSAETVKSAVCIITGDSSIAQTNNNHKSIPTVWRNTRILKTVKCDIVLGETQRRCIVFCFFLLSKLVESNKSRKLLHTCKQTGAWESRRT